MPNGNDEFDEKEPLDLESFFARIADILNAFAAKHNLMIDRYYHDSPSWRFAFRHPKGGVATVDVMREPNDSIKLYSYWWIDVYDKFTRFTRMQEGATWKIGQGDLALLLEEQLRTVLSWQPGEWTWEMKGFEKPWGIAPREWVENDFMRYPVPKI